MITANYDQPTMIINEYDDDDYDHFEFDKFVNPFCPPRQQFSIFPWVGPGGP